MSCRTRATSPGVGVGADNVPEGRPNWVPGTAGNPNISIPGVEASAVTTAAIVANTIIYQPFLVVTAITLDQLICEITTGVAGNARMGIYNADRNWQPTSLVVDGGQFATGVAAVITLAINVTLQPGRYLFTLHSNVDPTFRIVRGGSRYSGYRLTLSANPFPIFFRVAQAYGALPDPGIAWDNVGYVTVPFYYSVFCRISVP